MGALIKPLTTALYSKLTTSNNFNTAMGGRIFFEEYKTTNGTAPTTYPFAVFTYVSSVPDYTFTSSKEYTSIQISVFDTNPSAVNMLDYANKLYSLMDFAVLTITGWALIECRRESAFMIVPDETNSVRQLAATYRIYAQEL